MGAWHYSRPLAQGLGAGEPVDVANGGQQQGSHPRTDTWDGVQFPMGMHPLIQLLDFLPQLLVLGLFLFQ
jgi:hypothetical protein